MREKKEIIKQNLSQYPIFIVGFPRSGTTLLQSILATQKNVVSFPETHFFCSIKKHIKLNDSGFVSSVCIDEVFSKIKKYVDFTFNIDTKNEIIDLLNDKLTIKMLFEFLIISLIKDNYNLNDLDNVFWVEKTPGHINELHNIKIYYPNAKFIHIIRNPLNAIASYKKVFKNDLKPNALMHKWKNNIDIFSSFQKKYPKDTYEIRYETLVGNSIDESRKVCSFLSIDFDARRLDKIKYFSKKLVLKDEIHKHKNLSKNIENNKFLYYWGIREKTMLKYLAKDYLFKYGYNEKFELSLSSYVFFMNISLYIKKYDFFKKLIPIMKTILKKFNLWPYENN